MRSTRASAAVARLNLRMPDQHHSMVKTPDGLLRLVLVDDNGVQTRVSEPMEQDDFVAFVNKRGPQTPRRISKLDVAFEKQLRREK